MGLEMQLLKYYLLRLCVEWKFSYSAYHCEVPMRFITATHQAYKSVLKPSQLPGEYTAQLLPLLCPHMYPCTPGWREAITEKCLTRGH